MAKKISELNVIASLNESDVLPIVDVSANTTNKVTVAEIGQKVNVKNMITISLSNSNVTDFPIPTAWTYYPLTMTLVDSVVGNKLSLSNGGVLIGSGVSKVKVSANLMTKGRTGADYTIGSILLNSTSEKNAYMSGAYSTSQWVNSSISSFILDVQEGDVIYLGVGASSTGNVDIAGKTFTYMTVEVVE